MPATLVTIGTLGPAGQLAYQEYAESVLPLLDAVGGKALGRLKFREPLVGADFPEIVFVMEFKDDETIRAVFASAAYQALLPLRNQAFSEIKTFICASLQ